MDSRLSHFLSWLEKDFRLILPIEEGTILDARDRTPFDADWVQANAHLEERFQVICPPVSILSAIAKAREVAFKKVFAATGSHELSACSSDDIDLIAKAIVCAEESSQFIARLRSSYSSGRIAT